MKCCFTQARSGFASRFFQTFKIWLFQLALHVTEELCFSKARHRMAHSVSPFRWFARRGRALILLEHVPLAFCQPCGMQVFALQNWLSALPALESASPMRVCFPRRSP